MFFHGSSKDNDTTKQSSRPFSQSLFREEAPSKVFVPFRQQRDKLGRLLQSSLVLSRAESSNPEEKSKRMKEYLMNTICLDKDIKYQGFTVKEVVGRDDRVKSKSTVGKKLLVVKRKEGGSMFYGATKDCLLKRPKSAIILKSRESFKGERYPSEGKSVEKPKRNVYSFKFSYPKSVATYQELPVSDAEIKKVEEATTAENRRKRIRQEMPALMFVENVRLCAKPDEIHESWNNITLTKQEIISKLRRLQNN